MNAACQVAHSWVVLGDTRQHVLLAGYRKYLLFVDWVCLGVRLCRHLVYAYACHGRLREVCRRALDDAGRQS